MSEPTITLYTVVNQDEEGGDYVEDVFFTLEAAQACFDRSPLDQAIVAQFLYTTEWLPEVTVERAEWQARKQVAQAKNMFHTLKAISQQRFWRLHARDSDQEALTTLLKEAGDI